MKFAKMLVTATMVTTMLAGCASNGQNATSGTGGTGGAAGGTESAKASAPAEKTAEPTPAPKEEPKKDPVEIDFYFPVAVGGPVTEILDKMSAEFNAEHPDIVVKPTYAGSYAETMVKSQTAFQGGQPPAVAVLSSTELYTLLDMDAIVPLNDLIAANGGDEYKNDFYEAFMLNGTLGDTVYSIPFQRSTIIMYYNKDMFKAAGLDPEKAPANYAELIDAAKKLTKDGQWGIEIPSTGYTHWIFQAFALQNGKNVMSPDGKEVYFSTPENEKQLQMWVDLSKKHKVMPEGTLEWGTVPKDFIEGKTAMMYHTTGNLSKVKKDAKFEFGTAFLPAGEKGYGTPVGGGNFYIFKGLGEEKEQAAFKFIHWMTQPDRLAQFSIDTGYVAPTASANATETMKKYVAEFPQADTARAQLEYAAASISTHNNGQVQKIFEDNLQSAITGSATPADALKKAQEEATKVLEPFNK
ncbi:ABC transporter substrate-binding protein [Paenibacillus sp. TRM 82003]|nr:ABC transporter substrate-binding protein [Paenibacillus sp. TRM 82003]MCI3923364.1 ABC transporter substrate-binding protein [Paenibacillus sp. TRM 82003]